MVKFILLIPPLEAIVLDTVPFWKGSVITVVGCAPPVYPVPAPVILTVPIPFLRTVSDPVSYTHLTLPTKA